MHILRTEKLIDAARYRVTMPIRIIDAAEGIAMTHVLRQQINSQILIDSRQDQIQVVFITSG